MAGTYLGGKRAAKTNLERYGKDFYKQIGSRGGRNGRTGGFAANPELAKVAGSKGGKRSRRTSKYMDILDQNKKEIKKAMKGRRTYKSLAEELGVPSSSLYNYISTRMRRG